MAGPRYSQSYPLGAAGVRFKLKQYVQAAAQHVPSLTTRRVTPHTWPHSVGVQLVAAGVVDFQRNYPFVIINLQCTMQSADALRLKSDMAIQFCVPETPDLIVVKLGRLHVHPFASDQYLDLFGVPKCPDDLKNHRIVQQVAPGLDENAIAGFFGIDSIDNVVAIRTNSSTAHFYAIEKGAGIGVLPTFAVALGAPVIPVDIGHRYYLDIWLTYHPNARKTPRRALTIDWLKKIFDPKIHPWFRDEFIIQAN